MSHNAYIRIKPGAGTAVLFIHGICGSPNHFRELVPLIDLVPEAYSVYSILLDGHGKTAVDFAKTSMGKWKTQVRDVFDSLSQTHDHVILVGHSMGTLFSIQLAIEHPQKVPFLFLLAAPMRIWVRFAGLYRPLLLAFDKLRAEVPQEAAIIKACSIRSTRKIWRYIPWIPRFLELFLEIHRTKKQMKYLRVPCTAYQSRLDELVSTEASKVLERNSCITVWNLQHSSHFYYHPTDLAIVCGDFEKQIKETHG